MFTPEMMMMRNPPSAGWVLDDISSLSYASVNSGALANMQGCCLGNDDASLYVVSWNTTISQYNLSTPGDISTCGSVVATKSTSGYTANAAGICFSEDGTKMYVAGYSRQMVQYNLSTAWDLSTATYAYHMGLNGEVYAMGCAISTDGTKVFMMASNYGSITVVSEYSFPTAFALSSCSGSATNTFSIYSQVGVPSGNMFFNPDGTKFWVPSTTNDKIYQYSLSTAWDISTASYDSLYLSVVSQVGDGAALTSTKDGSKVFVGGVANDTLYEFS